MDVSAIESNMLALLMRWLGLIIPLGYPCHMVQYKFGHPLQAPGPIHVEYVAVCTLAKMRIMEPANGTIAKLCSRSHTPSTRCGLQIFPGGHRIRWSPANTRRTEAFLAYAPWVATHLELSKKEEYLWEDSEDASMSVLGADDGNILHGNWCLNDVVGRMRLLVHGLPRQWTFYL